MINQFFTYFISSFLGTFFHYIVLYCLVEFMDLTPVISSFLGAVVGALIIYVLNYYYVFNCPSLHFEAFLKFSCVALLNIILNISILKLLLMIFYSNYMILQVVTTGIVFIMTYVLNRFWAFRAKPQY